MAHIPQTAAFTEPLSRMDRLPVQTNPPMSPLADVRVEPPPTGNAHVETSRTTNARAETSYTMNARAETSHPRNARADLSNTRNGRVDTMPATDEGTKTVETSRRREELMEAHHSGPLLIPEFEETIDDIIQTVERSVHQSEAESFLLT